MDLRGTLIFASGALAALLGQTDTDLSGLNIYDLLDGKAIIGVRKVLDRVLHTGLGAHTAQCPMVLPGGTVRHLEFAAVLACDEQGSPRGFRGLVRDVTEREDAQAMSRATLDSQAAQICILDELGVVRVVNRAWDFAAGTGMSPEGFEVGGNYLTALERSRQLGLPDAAMELEGLKAVLEGRRQEFSLEYPKARAIKTRWFLLTGTPLVMDGRISGAVLSRLETTERRLAEEELTTLYKAMDSSIEGLALLSPEGACLFMNPAFAHLHGYDAPVELASRQWSDLYPPEELARIQSVVLPQLRQLGYWSGEMRGLLRGGDTYHEEVSFTLTEKGQVIISSVRDVSERKRSERALKESEQKFRAIFDGVMEGILVVEPSGPRLLAANRTVLEMFGHPAGCDLGSIDLLWHFPHAEAERLMEHLAHAMESRDHQRIRFRARRVDGALLWIEAIGTRIDFEGREVALVAVSDVTVRVESQAALFKSEALLRAVIESAQDLIFIKDLERRYVKVNPAMAKMFGRSVEEIEGLLDDVLFDAEGAAVSAQSDRLVLSGQSTDEEVVKHLRGRPCAFHTVKVPLRDASGQVLGICGIARDVTDRRLADQELKKKDALMGSMAEATRELLVTPNFSEAMGRALALLGPAIEADRVFLYQIHPREVTGEPVLSQRFEWTSDRESPQIDCPDYQNIPMTHSLAQRWKPLLENGGHVRQIVRDLPEEDRAIFSRNGVKSLMVLPVHCGRELWGCVGFSDCTNDRAWSPNERSILEAFSAAVGGALRRSRDEESLRRSEERLRVQVEGSRGFYYYLCDREMNYTYISSPNFEEITGYSVEYITSPHPSHVTDNPVNAVGEEWTRRVLEEALEPPPYLYEIMHRDGRLVMLEVYERPLLKDGQVVGLQGVAQDVTDRIRMEQALRESEERLRFLVENMPGTFFYIQNLDGTYAYVSPSVETITGYTPEFIMGPRESLSTDNPVNLEAQKITDRVLKEGYAPPPYQYEMRHRDGRPIMLEAYERPIVKDGKVVCALGLLHDITDRLAMQAKLEHYRQSEVMGHLSVGLAHEVRNPLFAINVTIEALQKKLAGHPEVEPYVEAVQDQTKRLATLIRDMLDLGRPSDPAHRETRQLEALAREAVDVLQENGPGSAGRLIIVPPPAPIVVRVEGKRIVEAFVNIIENALAFAPCGTPVRVTFEVLKDRAVARISDEGPGVSPEMLPILFRPFVTNRPGSTGLGLAVVERIVRDHGGEVWVENHAPGPGCTFSFFLPRGEGE